MNLTMTAPAKENFGCSGPVHLTTIDRNNSAHKRSVAASLVQGVYVLQRDQRHKRVRSDALAPPWWEHLSFQITRELVDDEGKTIFGAIYENKCEEENHSFSQAPKFVIAFRGNVLKRKSFRLDIKLDLQFIQNALHQTSRCAIAMQAVRNVVSAVGASNVWLAGHSLGAAMAMFAGREMANSELSLGTYLFNPPFISAPIEMIKDEKKKEKIRFFASLLTAGLAVASNVFCDISNLSEDTFAKLSPWFPCLFVNTNDHLCSEYVGYFNHREKMEEKGIGIIERLATKNSISDLVLKAFGRESEVLHLIPSAYLTINTSPDAGFKSAHGIRQWWRQDLNLSPNAMSTHDESLKINIITFVSTRRER